MTEKMITDAWARMRYIDNTIPDDVLDFMKDCAIEKIKKMDESKLLGNDELIVVNNLYKEWQYSGSLLSFNEYLMIDKK